jgi:hypothetical protein
LRATNFKVPKINNKLINKQLNRLFAQMLVTNFQISEIKNKQLDKLFVQK